jgi:hypothetical protein
MLILNFHNDIYWLCILVQAYVDLWEMSSCTLCVCVCVCVCVRARAYVCDQ